jgi:hypothetical protein
MLIPRNHPQPTLFSFCLQHQAILMIVCKS